MKLKSAKAAGNPALATLSILMTSSISGALIEKKGFLGRDVIPR